MAEALSLEMLSRYTGEPVDRLREWRVRGIIGDAASDSLSVDDIERVRLVQLLLRRGIAVDTIAEAAQSGLFDWYRDFPFQPGAGPVYSLAEAAEMLGLDLAMLQRFRDAMGSMAPDDFVHEDELELMRGWNAASQAGVPADAMIEIIRVYADNLDRIAEAEQRLFRFYIERPLEAEGLSERELLTRAQAAADDLNPLVEPIILYFHRRGLMRAVREDAVMRIAERAGLIEKSEVPGQLHSAIVFIDLSSFTPMTEAMGDVAAAHVLERFSEIVRRSVAPWGGRVVKQIGDAFMLVFPEPRSAVACALEIESRSADEPQFPAVRAGIHWGQVLYREGDYVGSNVNIASRLANDAGRHQILVTGEVRKAAAGLPGVEFVRLGKRRLKGLAESLVVFEVRPGVTAPPEKTIDPVCGMELGVAEVAARLSLEGQERSFCSEDCLRKFVVSPESYAG